MKAKYLWYIATLCVSTLFISLAVYNGESIDWYSLLVGLVPAWSIAAIMEYRLSVISEGKVTGIHNTLYRIFVTAGVLSYIISYSLSNYLHDQAALIIHLGTVLVYTLFLFAIWLSTPPKDINSSIFSDLMSMVSLASTVIISFVVMLKLNNQNSQLRVSILSFVCTTVLVISLVRRVSSTDSIFNLNPKTRALWAGVVFGIKQLMEIRFPNIFVQYKWASPGLFWIGLLLMCSSLWDGYYVEKPSPKDKNF